MPKLRAPLQLPVLTTLPTTLASGDAGKQVFFQGYPWSWDGTAWVRNGGASGASLLTGSIVTGPTDVPRMEFYQQLTDARIKAADQLSGRVSHLPPPDKDADELEMDVIDVWFGSVVDGQALLRLTGMSGPIFGTFRIDYTILKAA